MKTFLCLVALIVASGWIARHFIEAIEAVSATGGEADFSLTRKVRFIFAALIAAAIAITGLMSYPFPRGATVLTIITTLALAVIFLKFLRYIPTIETSLAVMVIALITSSMISGKLSTTDRWGWLYFLIEIAITAVTAAIVLAPKIKGLLEQLKLNIVALFSDSEDDECEEEENRANTSAEDEESDEEDSADDDSSATFFELLGDTWSRFTDSFMSVVTDIDWAGIFATVLKITIILGLCAAILFGFHMAELKFDFLPPYNH